jgi:hypothetical protein
VSPIIVSGGGGSSGTSLTLAQMRQELKSRLPDFLGDTRCNRLINEAYQEICEQEAWPFLEATTTGAAPLAISDLRDVLYVIDTTNDRKLISADVRNVADTDPQFDTTLGTPYCYWLSGDTVEVYPGSTDSLSVRYTRVPSDLASDGDTSVIPSRSRW